MGMTFNDDDVGRHIVEHHVGGEAFCGRGARKMQKRAHREVLAVNRKFERTGIAIWPIVDAIGLEIPTMLRIVDATHIGELVLDEGQILIEVIITGIQRSAGGLVLRPLLAKVLGHDQRGIDLLVAHRGTVAQDAVLSIKRIPVTASCNECGSIFPVDFRYDETWTCPNCGARSKYKMRTGMEFYISIIDVTNSYIPDTEAQKQARMKAAEAQENWVKASKELIASQKVGRVKSVE